jgi:hypothetical protein
VGIFRLVAGACRLASSLASLAKSASPAGTRNKAASVETQAVLEVFGFAAPGYGLSGSADLASEASDEADRSGPNPTRQTTTKSIK